MAPGMMDIRYFYRAGVRRFEVAEVLYRAEKFTDAAYLAGYAAECSIKALVLVYVPQGKRFEFVTEHFRGQKGHDFELLGALARRCGGVTFPRDVQRSLRIMTTWNTDLRYDPRLMPASEANAFLTAAAEVIRWVEGWVR